MLPFRAQLGIFVVVAAGLAQPAWTQTYPTQTSRSKSRSRPAHRRRRRRLVGRNSASASGRRWLVGKCGGAGGNLAAKSVSGAAA